MTVLVLIWYFTQHNSRVVQAERAYANGNLEEAMLLASEELEVRPDSDRARVVTSLVYMAIKDYANAKGELEKISPQVPERYSIARRELGRIAFEFGQAGAAEKYYRESIEANPQESESIDKLIFLLTLEGRSGEAQKWAGERVLDGVASPNYLTILGVPKPSLDASTEFAQRCLEANPGDSLPRLGLAYKAWRDDQLDEVREQLQPVIAQYPELVEAQALWCRLLVEVDDFDGFVAANDSLQDEAEANSEIWLSRGIWAEKKGQLSAAVRCLGESIRRNPNSQPAHYRLSQVLAALGDPELARAFAERSQQLTELVLAIGQLSRQAPPEKYRPIIELLEQMGRYREAAAWCQQIAAKSSPLTAWATKTQAQLTKQLQENDFLISPAFDLSKQLTLNDYALPDYQRSGENPADKSEVADDHDIHFEDEATQQGLVFTYLNGEARGDTETIMQMNGGGVAVIDYDHDSLPDLYFTQGGELPPQPISLNHRDHLFRNRGADAGFSGTTDTVGLHDIDYGQGVTVGDFDNDGFADLYVGNIGTNRLYRNHGDGTFSEVPVAANKATALWTSSTVMADLNQDGAPDLYSVTYLGGDALTRVCLKTSNPRCSPLQFAAEPDRIYLNTGDGRFSDVTGQFGLEAPNGRGVGIVAGDFDGSRRLSLFIANDMSANFYFRNQTEVADAPSFQEQAILSGLAYDSEGRVKGSMGVAAGDSNRDGLLDLFVTNFHRESNDLFLQQEGGLFRENSRGAELYHPSFEPLGWGTQFLDADLDGELDLIVTNGHVYDPRDPRIPFAMYPQFFRNTGHGQYSEIDSAKLGPFFQQARHGRALARLDWNQDGREDACISHMNQPAALLTNLTAHTGHWIAFRLVAIDSARDAIGTTIRLNTGAKTWTTTLTAGDGFHCSNERRLVLGLGDDAIIDSMQVIWPSGKRQEFPGLATDRDWLLVESREPLQFASETRPQ
jgi:tetratricopeptide (TPR) repeat protein